MNPDKKKGKWKPDLLVDIYLLTRLHGEKKACKILGLQWMTWLYWRKHHPEVQRVIDRAKKPDSTLPGSQTLQEYVYQNLNPDLKELWEEILAWDGHDTSWERATALLRSKNSRTRQQLFVHAMMHCSFSPSEACRMIALPKSELERWQRESPYFVKLMQEVNWHKKNFFEQGLMKLVEQQHPLAVLFANRTINRDRGYSEKVEVNHTGEVHHLHEHVVRVDEMKLPIDVRRTILDSMREAKAKRVGPGGEEVLELEDTGSG